MKKIDKITSYPRQKLSFPLESGEEVSLTLEFMPRQQGWFITELVYLDFIVRNLRVSTSPNILRQFRNIIPFGLCCQTVEKREPMFIEDFQTNSSSLYVMSSSEVKAYEDFLNDNKI